MLREVEYHAKMEHDNIVQYKTTWQGSILPDEEKIIEKLKCEMLEKKKKVETQNHP